VWRRSRSGSPLLNRCSLMGFATGGLAKFTERRLGEGMNPTTRISLFDRAARLVTVAGTALVLQIAAQSFVFGSDAPVYPLKTCVVTDEKLGSMGKAYVHHHDGQEVQFCCKSCLPKFNKDPQKYLKKVADAAKAQSK
jgi:YHS domain-containing protein